jgi:hypothetical protein
LARKAGVSGKWASNPATVCVDGFFAPFTDLRIARTKGAPVTPDLMALLQKHMHLTDEELALIMKDPEQLDALLDVVLDVASGPSVDRANTTLA